MDKRIQSVIEQLTPFLIIGVIVALMAGLFIVLSYVLLWGLGIGALLWLAAIVKNYFFSTKISASQKGRIIEHDK